MIKKLLLTIVLIAPISSVLAFEQNYNQRLLKLEKQINSILEELKTLSEKINELANNTIVKKEKFSSVDSDDTTEDDTNLEDVVVAEPLGDDEAGIFDFEID